jgi:tRNA (guanine37-N1)-methyltransferase
MWNVKIITAYPEMFPGVLGHSIIGKARANNKWSLNVINLHDFGIDERKSIDDNPFGGGPGMIIRPDVVEKAVMSITNNAETNMPLVYLCPSAKSLNQQDLVHYSEGEGIIILCGCFEGVDARVIDSLGFKQVSIGDYVLTGGEIAAQVLVEGCVRLLPGVLGHSASILEESFSKNLLEYPQYTRPQIWVDNKKEKHYVPDILLSGHHDQIKEWRKKRSIEITKKYRPDLLKKNNKI